MFIYNSETKYNLDNRERPLISNSKRRFQICLDGLVTAVLFLLKNYLIMP